MFMSIQVPSSFLECRVSRVSSNVSCKRLLSILQVRECRAYVKPFVILESTISGLYLAIAFPPTVISSYSPIMSFLLHDHPAYFAISSTTPISSPSAP